MIRTLVWCLRFDTRMISLELNSFEGTLRALVSVDDLDTDVQKVQRLRVNHRQGVDEADEKH